MNNEPKTNEHSISPNKKGFAIHKLMMILGIGAFAFGAGKVADNISNHPDVTTVTAESAHNVEKPEPIVSSINSVLPPTGQYENTTQTQDLTNPYETIIYSETNPAPTSGETLVVSPEAQVVDQLVPVEDQAALNKQLKYVEAHLNDPVDTNNSDSVNK